METRIIASAKAPKPPSHYAQALEVSGATRLLFVSGQVPEDAEGGLPDDFEAQARQAWANVLAQLEDAGMGVANLVKVTIFLARREDALTNRAVRQAVLGEYRPALTVIVTGIFDVRWLIEIEAIAAA
jgi:enamine deaminase RidA (YjgF/YER057c/UK114 family)